MPRHDPNVGGFTNITEDGQVVFNESRPFKSAYYYLLIVSSAVVTFNLGMFTSKKKKKITRFNDILSYESRC